MAFQNITLSRGGETVTGELVLEHSSAWQVAVNGRVGVYQKDEWNTRPVDYSDLLGGFEDLLGGMR